MSDPISARTKICGVIGDPIEHSVSPAMHNAAFKALNLDLVYLAFRVRKEELERAVNGVRSLGMVGINVTIPHKVAILRFLDALDPVAEAINAVNAVHNRRGELIGYNTDGMGALLALEKMVDLRAARIVLLGAGGAARSIAFCVAKECQGLAILNRTPKRAVELADSLSHLRASTVGLPLTNETIREALADADVLINATSVGMSPNVDETLVDGELMRPDLVVFDIVYNPPKTRLLREAEKAGAATMNGIDMLVYQGAASFEIWTGRKAPVDVMKRVALSELATVIE